MHDSGKRLLVGAVAAVVATGCTRGDPTAPGAEGASFGAIRVTTFTAGEMLDPDGFVVSVDERLTRNIGLNGTEDFAPIPIGSHPVQLSEIAGNCEVDGDNPLSVGVVANTTSRAHFTVRCGAPDPAGTTAGTQRP